MVRDARASEQAARQQQQSLFAWMSGRKAEAKGGEIISSTEIEENSRRGKIFGSFSFSPSTSTRGGGGEGRRGMPVKSSAPTNDAMRAEADAFLVQVS